MNFKRVLVLVMALAMMVTACVTPVLAAMKPEAKHEHLENVLNNPEYQEKYEEIKGVVEDIVKDIEENHEEYYAQGYAYALENGYIGTAIEVIGVTLETLPQIDLDELGLTEELQAKLEAELDALEPTLEKLLAILESGEASDFDGFVNAALTLEGDLYLHMNNIYAILEQGSIDANQLVLVPAFNEALRLLNEEVIPAIEEAVEAYVDAVVDHVVEALTPYYNAVVEALGVAYDTYKLLVETLVKFNLYVEGAIDTVVNAYNTIMQTLINIYGTVDNAIKTAYEFYNNVVDAVLELNAKVENAIARVKLFVINVTNAYRYTVNLLVRIYGEVKTAVTIAGQIYDVTLDFIVENGPLFEEGLENAADILAEVVEIVEAAYAEKEDVYYVVTVINSYIMNLLNTIDAAINDRLDSAYVGDYELKDDSAYVSFGNASYADALAGKLNLTNKHTVATFGSDYIDTLVNADLVTVKLDNGSFMKLAEAQLEGKLAEIITSNNDLMAWYNGIEELKSAISSSFWLPEEYKSNVVNGLTEIKGSIDSVVDVNAEVVELDWDKYLDEEGKEALNKFLANVRAKVIEEGIPEYYYIDINPIIDEMLVENGLGGIFTLSFEPIVVPQADLVVFAVENMIYGYAEFVGNLRYVLDNASDDATIVLTPVSNPLYGYSFKGMDLGVYAEEANDIVDLLNAHLYGLAVANDNVVFVNSENADDIYNALNVYCDHVISGCTDTTCDRCLAKVTAPGHSFTNYVFNNDAKCNKDGTETAKCDFCDATDKRTVRNSKTEHEWQPATCTAYAKCVGCGLKDEEAGFAPHVLGDWRTIKDPTSNSAGLRERKCTGKGCEYKITESIPYKQLSTIATVAIVVSCVAGLGALSALVAGFFRKKNKI